MTDELNVMRGLKAGVAAGFVERIRGRDGQFQYRLTAKGRAHVEQGMRDRMLTPEEAEKMSFAEFMEAMSIPPIRRP